MKEKKDIIFPNESQSNEDIEDMQLSLLVKIMEAISRMTYKGIYIYDYLKKGIPYVSDNPLFLCGHTSEEVKKMGYKFFTQHIPPEDHSLLVEIKTATSKFFNTIPIEEKLQYTIYSNFHLMNDKKKWLINHQLTPALLNKKGECRLAICMVSLSPYPTAGHIIIKKVNLCNHWEYDLITHQWKKCKGTVLTEREKEILYLSAQGFTMEEIANKLFIGVDTVKFHKRKIFSEKLQVNNIIEAISLATCYKLI